MADSLPTPADSPQVELEPTSAEDHLAQGIRFLALSKYAQASESLSYAVEALTEQNGELSIENVDALVLYGKALLANAIEQTAVLGSNPPAGAVPSLEPAAGSASAASSTNANATAGPSSTAFHFGGDGEDEDDEEEEPNPQEQDGPEDDEDDFEAAFQVLDIARKTLELEIDNLDQLISELQDDNERKPVKVQERRTRKEKLADVHKLLGDVATESEQFENAVEEYSSALSILTKILPPSDRQLSQHHMLIALALEFLPNQIGRAVSHAEKAKSVLVLRLQQLESKPDDNKTDKDKREIVDINELLGDVDNKIEDLKTVPTEPAPSASDLALESFLRSATGAAPAGSTSAPVNDLNSLVKKKKKPTPAPASEQARPEGKTSEVEEQNGKRKAEEPSTEQEEKKVKVSDPPSL
ncbi:Hif1p [Sporobolomyces koalae]|uniref:Hif1p n=1 Tax=Sporobolomyces koalae TaxID=500713 RepID=UPI003172749F